MAWEMAAALGQKLTPTGLTGDDTDEHKRRTSEGQKNREPEVREEGCTKWTEDYTLFPLAACFIFTHKRSIFTKFLSFFPT